MSFINQALKGVSHDYYKRLLEACQGVSSEDVLKAMQKYLLPIFQPETSVAFVVSAPGKADDIFEVSIFWYLW
jgi:Zn-dependent M16 (insulinase) family peptidase